MFISRPPDRFLFDEKGLVLQGAALFLRQRQILEKVVHRTADDRPSAFGEKRAFELKAFPLFF